MDKASKKLVNTLIAFETDESRFKKLSDRVIEHFRSLGIPAVSTERPFHVSVSYISKGQEEGDLFDLMEEAEGAGSFRSKQFVGLKGKDGNTYIALQLEASPKFFNFKRKVDDMTESRGFAQGFKTHVSLAKIPTSSMVEGSVEELNDFFNPVFSINSDRVLLYDQSHKIYRSMEANLELIEHLEAKNRMGRHAMESLMRRIMEKHTKNQVFRDDYWKPISSIQKDFAAEMIDMDLMKAEYYHNKDSKGMPDGKEWIFHVPYSEKGGWILRIVASFGPSLISKPMSAYDLIYTLTWSGKIKKEATLVSRLRKIALALKD